MSERMLLRGVCPGCRKRVKGESRSLSKEIDCPGCGTPVLVARAEEPTAPEPRTQHERPSRTDKSPRFVRVVVPLNRLFGNRPLVLPKRCAGCWTKDVAFEVKLDYGTGNRTGHDGMGPIESVVVPLHVCGPCFGHFEEEHVLALAEVRIADDSASVENAIVRREFKDGRCHLGFANERYADALLDENPNVAFASVRACKAAERREAMIFYPLAIVFSIMAAALLTGIFFGVLEKALG